MPIIEKLKQDCGEIFPVAEYAYTMIPTYPSGSIGFMVCSKDKDVNVRKPVRFEWDDEFVSENLKYYNAKIHEASFVLPNFADKILNKK